MGEGPVEFAPVREGKSTATFFVKALIVLNEFAIEMEKV